MLITATQKTTRQTARKLGLVAAHVPKGNLETAVKQLVVIERRGADLILKVVRQAAANASHNYGLDFKDLVLKEIRVGQGPSYRRFRAVSRGRAHSIVKKTSHVTVVLEAAREKSATPQKNAGNTSQEPGKKTAKKTADSTRSKQAEQSRAGQKLTNQQKPHRLVKDQANLKQGGASTNRTTNK